MGFELILPFLRPIEPLLLDDGISEIMGNPDGSWWSERDGTLHLEAGVCFDRAKLLTGLEVIANHLGKRLDEDNPRLQTQLPDGSRLAAWIPPLVMPSPALAIRKFNSRHFTMDDLIDRATITPQIAAFLAEEIRTGKTLIISGGTGSGKTTLLRILAGAIPDYERIVLIEDTPELEILKPNIVPVGSQTNTFKAAVSFDELLKDALRFRPDRIILGEVRGVEARTLLDSFNTGHGGSLTTIHANSAAKALTRFANLVMRSHAQSTYSDTEAEIGECVDYVVHVDREPGRRVVREVLALNGYDRMTQRFRHEMVYNADSKMNLDHNPSEKDTDYAIA
jgi:pilus assembly protein CpaF